MAYNAVVSTEPSTGNWKKIGQSQAESEPLASRKLQDQLYQPSKKIIFPGAL